MRTASTQKCGLLYLLTGDESYLDTLFKSKPRIQTYEEKPVFMSNIRKEVLKYRPKLRKGKGRNFIHKHSTHFRDGCIDLGKPKLQIEQHRNYKGARVMRPQTKKLHKQVRFNHTDWTSGDLRKSGWTEVYFRPYDESDKRKQHLSEK